MSASVFIDGDQGTTGEGSFQLGGATAATSTSPTARPLTATTAAAGAGATTTR